MEHNHLKISWIHSQFYQKDGAVVYPPPYHEASAPPSSSSSSSSSGARISPAVLFTIVILAVLFFVSGLLHLLVRCLIKHPSSSGSSRSNRFPEVSGSDALQRQLQQLFHLHDTGLDQGFIDALPVFQYKEIVGLKEPFDCAVCLCEFTEKDKLRLLPTCNHAFHINCIDTWLLSNSTCPLCRSTLFAPGFPIENPMFDFEELTEEDGCSGNGENGIPTSQKTAEIEEVTVGKGILHVRLGKFRKLDGEVGEACGETSSSNLDARRCFSMGSYQYVLGESSLRVPFTKNRPLRIVTEETEQNVNPPSAEANIEGQKIGPVRKGESFSISKIWLWPKKGRFLSSSDTQSGIPSSLNMELPSFLGNNNQVQEK